MNPRDFDRDMFGFTVSLVGMVVCVLASAVWRCLP